MSLADDAPGAAVSLAAPAELAGAASEELDAASEPDEHADRVSPTSAVAMTSVVRVLIVLIAYS